jgi:hypothetical protein
MAINQVYREEWVKPNMWRVRAEFIAGGGEPAKYGDRTVTAMQGAFKEVAGHKASFTESLPFGAADGESCRFVVDYNALPSGMQSAITAQNATVDAAYFGDATVGKYRTPKYLPQSIYANKPKQPNLFMVWSDRGTSNGVVTGLSIAYGGTAWATNGTNVATEPYFPQPMDTKSGVGLRISYTVTAGEITAVSITAGGTGYKVGQQVKVEDALVPGRYAYFTITSVQASTWYPEFIGCQRLSPSTKYSAQIRGLEIEIEAIGLHKICLEAISDLTTYTRQYASTLVDNFGANIYDSPRFSTTEIWDFDYKYISTYSGVTGKMGRRVVTDTKLVHWHAPLGSIFGFLDAAFDEAFEFFSMEGYQLDTTSSTNLKGSYPATTSNMKLQKLKFAPNNLTMVDLGDTDGDLHTDLSEISCIRFIFAVTIDEVYQQNPAYVSEDQWVGGLFTDDENGIKKDCDSAWDLFKKMCEQFFLKMTPYYELSSTLLKAKWKLADSYGTASSAATIIYSDTASESKFEVNAETIEGAKLHHLVTGDNQDTQDFSSYTKSGKKIEINNIFDIRIRSLEPGTKWLQTDFTEGCINYLLKQPYANLRGIYFMPYPSLNNFSAHRIHMVAPTITLKFTFGAGTTTTYPYNAYYNTGNPRTPDYLLYEGDGTPNSAKIAASLQAIQLDQYVGFGVYGILLTAMFGVYYDPTSPDTLKTEFASNNQTMYDMTRPLSTDVLPSMIGQRIDITPHVAVTGAVSPKAYLVELEIDWTARDKDSDYVKAKYLTRSIGFN